MRVSVFEVPVTDEVKDAVQQMVEDLRSSEKTRGWTSSQVTLTNRSDSPSTRWLLTSLRRTG